MKTYLVRGVPASLQHDGWWLSGLPDRARATRQQAQDARSMPLRVILMGLLIVLADVLVWQVVPGLSLAVFCALVVLAAMAVRPGGLRGRRGVRVLGGTFLAVMPLVELVQPLSLMIAAVGLSLVLATVAGVRRRALGHAALRLWPMGIALGAGDLAGTWPGMRPDGGVVAALGGLARGWAVPLGLGGFFALLLLVANPVASAWLDRIPWHDPDLPAGDRVMFWAWLVPAFWTVLNLHRLKPDLAVRAPRRRDAGDGRAPGLINPASTARALVLFNAVFAVQTGMDAVYLYGGAALPDGITYAEYAHRGAYPLVVTALLAGVFALLCQRWITGAPLLRLLLMVWVAQNVALVISSEVRLSLYVEVYGQTRLRIAAAIWMALVATGLAMILWQVGQGRTNRWLLVRLGALGGGVLYVCAWISFDAAIARYNLGHDVREDRAYLCALGEGAQPVIAAHEMRQGWPLCDAAAAVAPPGDWREWGFRNWRARHSLTAMNGEALK